jgi:hypothetical protein
MCLGIRALGDSRESSCAAIISSAGRDGQREARAAGPLLASVPPWHTIAAGRMKTIILNTDSLLNPGDAAIVLAQVRLLRKLRPGCTVALTSRTPDLDRSFFGPLGVEVHPALLPAPSLWRGPGHKLFGSLSCAWRAWARLPKSRTSSA